MSNQTSQQTQTAQQTQALTPNGNKAFVWYAVAVFLLILDQWSKWHFESILDEGQSISVIEPILNWTLKYNPGAAFSFLASQGGWQKFLFGGLALAVSAFLIWYLRVIPRKARLLSVALAFILSGAVGNLIDRILHGHVIDFIHVHYANVWHYPVFNIADCGIVIGVVFMVIDMLFLENKRILTQG